MRMMFASIMFAAASCFAYVVGPNGEWAVNYPTELKTNGQVTYNATPAMCAAAGWRYATQAEIDAKASAEAAAQAEAEAQATLPQVFPTGIAVTNSAGHWVEFVPDGTNVVARTLAIQISQSPLTPEQREAMKAAAMAEREAKLAEAKAAKQKGNLQGRIAALEALLGVDP